MFVATGSRARLLDRRRQRFTELYVAPLLAEARKLDLDLDELVTIIQREGKGTTP
jgi:hypothetical protein